VNGPDKSKVRYRCNVCGLTLKPIEASKRGFICHNQPMERVEASSLGEGFLERLAGIIAGRPRPSADRPCVVTPQGPGLDQPSARAGGDGESEGAEGQRVREGEGSAALEVVEVVPPADNQVDALAVETFLGGLATKEPFSLEICGDERGKHFLVRGRPETVGHIKALLASVYGQVALAPVSQEDDPALLARNTSPDRQAKVALGRLVLRRPPYLPLRTFRDGDFRDSDPLKGLLAPFSDLRPGERVLSQLILKPAPLNWADAYQGSLRRLEQSFGTSGPGILAPLVTFVLMPGFLFLLLRAYLWFREGQYLPLLLMGLTLPLVLMGGLFLVLQFLISPRNVDPVLVQRKVALPAYDACLRLVVIAPDQERARARLEQLAAAYHQFNLSSGNAFVFKEESFDPGTFPRAFWSIWEGFLGRIMRLNTGEIASLWHLPVGEVKGVGQVLSKAILPMRDQVADGVLVGHSRTHGVEIPVHLSPEAMSAHILLIGKTQKGKSVLMQHLVHAAFQDPECAVVVIDPHGDLVSSCLGIIPRSRVVDTIYVDFSHEERVVGVNLLDVNQGRSADKIVSNLVHVCSLIWADYWGPRMEDAFRAGVRTLLEVNAQLPRGEKQFTILDLPALYELRSFRNRLLHQYVHEVETLRWWIGYYDQLYDSLKMDVINPVQTKIHRFSTSSVVRRIVGQSDSTVDFREILEQRRIVLINTASGVIGEDAGGLLGAVLLDNLNVTVREQMKLPPEERARVMVFIDEFQSIPGVDYGSLLAELAKMGANFVLATQSLAQLDLMDRHQRFSTRALRPTVLANVDTLFVFQTSAEDARALVGELDRKVAEVDIINQPDFVCYLKTKKGRERLPVMQIHTLPPVEGSREIEELVRQNMARYSRPAWAVDRERASFLSRHYGAEISVYEAHARRRLEGAKPEALQEPSASSGDSPRKKRKRSRPR